MARDDNTTSPTMHLRTENDGDDDERRVPTTTTPYWTSRLTKQINSNQLKINSNQNRFICNTGSQTLCSCNGFVGVISVCIGFCRKTKAKATSANRIQAGHNHQSRICNVPPSSVRSQHPPAACRDVRLTILCIETRTV